MRDACIRRASQEEQLRLRLKPLQLDGRTGDRIGLRNLGSAMGIKQRWETKGHSELVEELVSALLAETPAVAVSHASFLDAALQELREVRDGVSGQEAQFHDLETYLGNPERFKMKNLSDDDVTLVHLCQALQLRIARHHGGGMSRAELVEQIAITLMLEVCVHSSDVGQSSFGMAVQLCLKFENGQLDLDSCLRSTC